MSYQPLYRDLTEAAEKCHFCHKCLTSLKAYVLKDLNVGNVVFAGPYCAKNNIDSNMRLQDLPDLTKYTDSINDRQGGVGGRGGTTDANNDRKRAIEYLVLREEKLVNALNTSYPLLKTYYEKMQFLELTDNEVKHINNIEANAPQILKLTRLQKCYNYYYWIDIGIKRLGPTANGYLKSIQAMLVKNHDIPPDKLKATNKWLMHIDGVPQLK